MPTSHTVFFAAAASNARCWSLIVDSSSSTSQVNSDGVFRTLGYRKVGLETQLIAPFPRYLGMYMYGTYLQMHIFPTKHLTELLTSDPNLPVPPRIPLPEGEMRYHLAITRGTSGAGRERERALIPNRRCMLGLEEDATVPYLR